jgi:hypothetical protein
MKKPVHPDAFVHIDPTEFAIDKGRLYGIAKLLEIEGYASSARDVRAAADYIQTMRAKQAH